MSEDKPAESTQRKQPIQLPKGDPEEEEEEERPAPAKVTSPVRRPLPAQPVRPPSLPDDTYDDVQVQREPEPENIYDDAMGQTADDTYDDVRADDPPDDTYDDVKPAAPLPTRNLLADGMPRRPPSDDEQEEDQNWDGRKML